MNDRIARRAAQHAALGVTDTRGARFAQRWSGYTGPGFADMAAVPRWLMLAPEIQMQAATAAGLMHHREAINNELSGPKLAILAQAVGEDLLDAACASHAPDSPVSHAPLPRPDMIVADGWALLHAGLPVVFAARFPDAGGNSSAREASERAVDLVLAL